MVESVYDEQRWLVPVAVVVDGTGKEEIASEKTAVYEFLRNLT